MRGKNLTPNERLEIWQSLLDSPEGTTYDEFSDVCYRKSGKSHTYYDQTARHDIKIIKKLLENTEVYLKETTVKKKKTFFLSGDVDLVSLYNQDKVMKPYQDLFCMLERMEGFLPQSLLEDLSSAYKRIKENQSRESVISFSTDYKAFDALRFFPDVYKAINKYGLLVERHRLQTSDTLYNVILYPEYLKQYNSEWFVFGVVTDENGNRESENCSRIPMSLIENVKQLRTSDIPFIHSNTDYDEYFEDIIGVENDSHCEVERVKLRVSKKMFGRLMKYPIHDSQRECKEISTPTMRGISIDVRRNKELIRTLLNYGRDIEVVEPLKLRKQMIKELEKTLNLYQVL